MIFILNDTEKYPVNIEARLIGSSRIQTQDLLIVRRTRCHLSYRALVCTHMIFALIQGVQSAQRAK